MRGTHIVSFDMKRLGVKHRTQILDTRQARNRLFTMDYSIIIVLLTVVLSSSGK
jgi:predicted nucleic acid-binding Zn ribbon protein